MRYSIKPSKQDLQSVNPLIESTIETCESFLVKEDNFQTFLSWSETFSPEAITSEKIRIYFNTEEKNWEEQLSACVAQGYSQSWFLEYKDITFHWEEILQLGHSLLFAEQVAGYKPELDDKEVLKENWPAIREELDAESHVTSENLNRLGFSLSYYIAKELSETHELEKFPELTLASVIDAGDKLFT